MRSVSIRLKVTLWYTLLVAFLAAFSVFSVAAARHRVEVNYYRDTLESTSALAAGDIAYVDGMIEIDRNLDEIANVRAAVYDEKGELIYGKVWFEADFSEGEIRRITDREGAHWYVRDDFILPEGGDGVWLRLYIASDASEATNSGSMRLMMIMGPVTVLLAAAGGWIITKAAFRPVEQISRTTKSIMDGRDLKKRVDLPDTKDEIYALAAVIDTMLERLDESFERERRFTSDAAHELRTPVAAIMAQSEAALSGDGDMAESLEDIRGRAGDMSALIGQLLALTRMDAGRMAPEMEEVDIAEMCRAVCDIAGAQAEISGEGVCRCDQSMMTRVMMNLVENTRKYAGEDAGIWINISGGEDVLHIEVRDDGPGIAEKDIEHVFERFYQGDGARASKGAGLGLAMVKQIVTLHGGCVGVRNDGGAVFDIELPRRGV